MTLNGARSETVFWFEPDDVQEAVNRMLKESLDRLMADAKVENRLLQSSKEEDEIARPLPRWQKGRL